MCWVSANKNVLSSRLNSVRQMSCCRSSAGRLFHSRGRVYLSIFHWWLYLVFLLCFYILLYSLYNYYLINICCCCKYTYSVCNYWWMPAAAAEIISRELPATRLDIRVCVVNDDTQTFIKRFFCCRNTFLPRLQCVLHQQHPNHCHHDDRWQGTCFIRCSKEQLGHLTQSTQKQRKHDESESNNLK